MTLDFVGEDLQATGPAGGAPSSSTGQSKYKKCLRVHFVRRVMRTSFIAKAIREHPEKLQVWGFLDKTRVRPETITKSQKLGAEK